MSEPVNTLNKFLIGKHGGDYLFLKQVPVRISEEDALVLAAYIVAMCESEERWKEVFEAVSNA